MRVVYRAIDALIDHRWTAVALVCIAALVTIMFVRSDAQDRAVREQNVAGCERGNLIRGYLSFDNEQRIERIETLILSPGSPDKAELREELQLRLSFVPRLLPFSCESLR